MYPRAGSALLPRSLHPAAGALPVPAELVESLGVPTGATLASLDAEVWGNAPPETIRRAASYVVEILRPRMGDLMASQEVVVPAGTRFDELPIANRTRNILIRAGYRSGFQADLTLSDIARLPNLGALSLLDIATVGDSLLAHGARRRPSQGAGPSKTVVRLARKIARRRWAARVGREDPRLGVLLRELHPDAADASRLPDVLAGESLTAGQARSKAVQLRKFDAAAKRLKRLCFADELQEFLSVLGKSDRGAAMLRARLGFDTGMPATLEEAGNVAGVTRERVRQVEKRFKEAVRQGPDAWTPALDEVVRAMQRSLPTTIDRLQSDLVGQGLLPPDFPLLVAFRAAEAFGKQLHLSHDPDTGLIAGPGAPVDIGAVSTQARRLVEHWGATTTDEVAAQLQMRGASSADQEVVRLIVSKLDGFTWLDPESGWFWLRRGRNRLLNQIEKIMSVAGQVDIGELRDGVGRPHRMKGFRPPREVLARLCVQSELYTRTGERISGAESLPDWRRLLGINERTIAEIMFEYGPVMRRDEFERIAVDERGLNRSSFYVYLVYSPILARYAPGVYGLRGAPISAGEIRALIPQRARTQVLQDHGWTADGSVWIAYKLSDSVAASGVLNVPGPLRAVLSGSYALSAEDKDPVGTLVVGDSSSMWGVSPFFRRRGVEAGDHLVLQIDLSAKTATISSGAEELLLRFQEAE